MKRTLMLVMLAATAVLSTAAAAHAGVNVNIGLSLGAPPQLVAVPGTPVAYAPALPANYFFYGGQYYVFTNSAWYVAPTYNGPWAVVAPAYVPRPLLTVPVGYYRVRPAGWRYWYRDAAPRWDGGWGRDWRGHPGDGRFGHQGPPVAYNRDRDRDGWHDRDQQHDRDHRW